MIKLTYLVPIALGSIAAFGVLSSQKPHSAKLESCISDVDVTSPVYKKAFAEATAQLKQSVEAGNGIFQACYTPDTPKEIIAAFEQAMRQFQGGGAWPPLGGRGVNYFLGGDWGRKNLTWSFVPDGTNIPAASFNTGGPSNLFAQMDAKFGGNRALWISKFDQIFARWSALSGHTYTRVTTGGNDWDDGATFPSSAGAAGLRGDIRISGRTGSLNGVLAYNYYPSTGDMVIDMAEGWQSSTNDYLFLRNTLGHEHGHGLGIAHVCPTNTTKLMEPFLATNFDGPQQDDVRACHQIYGDKYESNNTAATATPLGNATAGGSAIGLGEELVSRPANTSSLSLGNNTDIDFLTFNINRRAAVNVTVTPVGSIYLDGPQNPDGSCTAGTNINALAVKDLVLTVYGGDGTTVLGSANATAAGGTETTRVILPNSGNYYARVTQNTATTQSQLYKIAVTPEALKFLSGTVSLVDIASLAGQNVTIEFRTPGTTTVIWSKTFALTGSALSLELDPLITPGTYDIAFKGAHHLRVVVPNIAVGAGGASGVSLSDTINGDINGDNRVNLADFSALSAAYGSVPASANWNANSDLNGDARVNLSDFSILSRDYGKIGAN